MTHYELAFKLQHDCPFNDISKEFPSVIFSHWCNYERDVIEVTYDDLTLFNQLQDAIQNLAKRLDIKIMRKIFTKPNVQVVAQHCGCNRIKLGVSPTIERHNCLELQPTTYRDGWEWYRVIAFSDRDIKGLFRDLDRISKVEILSRRRVEDGSVRDTFLISTANLLGELTKKQLQALVVALNSGYYRVPKKITTEEISERLGLPRTTYEEHLRKAESKILGAVAPYVQLKSQ